LLPGCTRQTVDGAANDVSQIPGSACLAETAILLPWQMQYRSQFRIGRSSGIVTAIDAAKTELF
jgi:hypothetical protein